jgi:hypothetical protein
METYMAKVTVQRTINRSLDKVWEVAADFMKSPGKSITVIPGKAGDPAVNGIGCERTIMFGKSSPIQERLEAINPKSSFEFSIVSGAPAVKSLLIKAEFAVNNGVTQTKWTGTFVPKNIFLCLIIHMVIKRNINMILDELEKIR